MSTQQPVNGFKKKKKRRHVKNKYATEAVYLMCYSSAANDTMTDDCNFQENITFGQLG